MCGQVWACRESSADAPGPAKEQMAALLPPSAPALSRVSSCRRAPTARCHPTRPVVTLAPDASPSRPSPWRGAAPAAPCLRAGRSSLDGTPAPGALVGPEPGGAGRTDQEAWTRHPTRHEWEPHTSTACVRMLFWGGRPRRARMASRRAYSVAVQVRPCVSGAVARVATSSRLAALSRGGRVPKGRATPPRLARLTPRQVARATRRAPPSRAQHVSG
jgi:hypothetical protein